MVFIGLRFEISRIGFAIISEEHRFCELVGKKIRIKKISDFFILKKITFKIEQELGPKAAELIISIDMFFWFFPNRDRQQSVQS